MRAPVRACASACVRACARAWREHVCAGTLCENLDTLDESEAKAAMVWIVGEYAERIDNAPEVPTRHRRHDATPSHSKGMQYCSNKKQ